MNKQRRSLAPWVVGLWVLSALLMTFAAFAYVMAELER